MNDATMSALANPIFPQTGLTSRPASPAPNRVSPLECTLTKNAPASPLQSTLTKSLDLKSFRFRTYKKGGWGVGSSRTRRTTRLVPRMPSAALPGLFSRLPSTEPPRAGAGLLPVRRRTVPLPGAAMPGYFHRNPVPCRSFEWCPNSADWDSTERWPSIR